MNAIINAKIIIDNLIDNPFFGGGGGEVSEIYHSLSYPCNNGIEIITWRRNNNITEHQIANKSNGKYQEIQTGCRDSENKNRC